MNSNVINSLFLISTSIELKIENKVKHVHPPK